MNTYQIVQHVYNAEIAQRQYFGVTIRADKVELQEDRTLVFLIRDGADGAFVHWRTVAIIPRDSYRSCIDVEHEVADSE